MSFFSDLNPVNLAKNFHSSSMDLAKNPFSKDAIRNWQSSMHPGLIKPKNSAKQDQPVVQEEFYQPQLYQAPQSYEPFAQSFQPQQRPPVTDIYQRGAMPNDLLARYNSMAQMLQQQQAAMVPRTQPQMMPEGQAPWMGAKKPNPYTNFAQLFGGRNG